LTSITGIAVYRVRSLAMAMRLGMVGVKWFPLEKFRNF